jgi:hypothetical protein
MDATIHLDAKLHLGAVEIEDVLADGMLPTKFQTEKSPVAHPVPNGTFRRRHPLAKRAGTLHKHHDRGYLGTLLLRR